MPRPIAQHPLRYKIGCSWLALLSPRRKHPAARPLPSPPPECTRRYKAARTTKPIACFVAPSLYVLCPAIPAGFGSTPCPRPAGVERSSCLCAARLHYFLNCRYLKGKSSGFSSSKLQKLCTLPVASLFLSTLGEISKRPQDTCPKLFAIAVAVFERPEKAVVIVSRVGCKVLARFLHDLEVAKDQPIGVAMIGDLATFNSPQNLRGKRTGLSSWMKSSVLKASVSSQFGECSWLQRRARAGSLSSNVAVRFGCTVIKVYLRRSA